MNKRKLIQAVSGFLLGLLGVILVCLTRAKAIAQDAPLGSKLLFILGLLGILLGVLILAVGLLSGRRQTDIRTVTMSAMFAALCYVGFAFFQIKIPVGDSATSFHLGNVFCVLAALCIGPLWGGLAGAVGMSIGDLFDPVYITSAPKTFLLKLCIGLLSGLVAHKLFRISQDRERKVPLAVATVLSCSAGMAFNIVADPLVGYLYKMYVLGIPQDAATILAKIAAVTTSVNAVIAVIAASIFYLALRPILKRSQLLPKL